MVGYIYYIMLQYISFEDHLLIEVIMMTEIEISANDINPCVVHYDRCRTDIKYGGRLDESSGRYFLGNKAVRLLC